jgi:putative transposase
LNKKRTPKTEEKNKILEKEGKQLRYFGLVLRIYPDEVQQNLCARTFGCVRLVFNKYLDARQKYYRETSKTLSVAQFKRETLVPWKKSESFCFLSEVDKFPLEVACENVDDAYQRFFKGQNCYPTFKSKRTAKKAYTTKFTNNNIEIINKKQIKLPKLGIVKLAKIKTERNEEIIHKITANETRIKKATITQKGNRFYVSLVLEEVVPLVHTLSLEEAEPLKIVGIDLGLKTFAAISNGEETYFIKKANYIKTSEKKLTKLQRRLSKKKKDSENFKKAAEKVNKLQSHIANQRRDFNHKLSTKIADENQAVILERLNIKGMVKNRRLSKAISDAGWYQFIAFLEYKMRWQGKAFVQIDRWYASSKTCSACGEKNIALTLSEREWQCSSCGATHERDENAAINIRNKGMENIKNVA